MSAPSTGFRPASGWQFGEPVAAPAPARSLDGVRRPLATALLLVVAYLVMVQGIVAVASASDATPVALLDAAFTWLAGGATLGVLFALASRSTWMIAITGLVAGLDAIAYVVLGATGLLGVWDPPIVAIALALSVASAVLGILGATRGRAGLSTTALVLGVLGVAAFYGISVVAPIVGLGLTEQTIAAAVRTPPVPILAIAAGVLLTLRGRVPGILAGIALIGFAGTLVISPVVTSLAGSPPVAGALVVIVLRVALTLAAAVVVLVTARRS